MFKLSYDKIKGGSRYSIFENFPSIQEVEQISGIPMSQTFYNRLKNRGWVSGESGHYTVLEFQVPTIHQLQQTWNDWLKVGVYEDQRFGQYVYNKLNYEEENRYNIENAKED